MTFAEKVVDLMQADDNLGPVETTVSLLMLAAMFGEAADLSPFEVREALRKVQLKVCPSMAALNDDNLPSFCIPHLDGSVELPPESQGEQP